MMYETDDFSFFIQIQDNEDELSSNILQLWEDLSYQAKVVDASLVSVKTKFTQVCFLFIYLRKYIKQKLVNQLSW